MAGFRRHFCFCVPVRFGVFITSLSLFVLAAILSGIAFWLTWVIDNDPRRLVIVTHNFPVNITITRSWKIGIIVFGSVFALVSLISFFGFIGSVVRNRRMIKAYATLSWIEFVVMFFASIPFLYITYSPNAFGATFIKLSTVHKVLNTVGMVFAIFIQLYICVIIDRYAEQLEVEKSFKSEFGFNKAFYL